MPIQFFHFFLVNPYIYTVQPKEGIEKNLALMVIE